VHPRNWKAQQDERLEGKKVVEQPSFGIDEVDKLMGGGIPFGSSYLMETEPGAEELCFIAAFINEGLRQGNVCYVLLFDLPHEDVISKLTELGVNMKEALDLGSMTIIDLWTEGKYDPDHRSSILMTDNLSDPNSVLRLFYDLAEINDKKQSGGKYTGSRVVVLSLSSQIMSYKFEPTYKIMKAGMNFLGARKVLSMSVISPDMFDETEVAAFEHLNHGVVTLSMKESKGRLQRFFRVKKSPLTGFYTDEVPYDIVGRKPRLVTPFAEPLSAFRSNLRQNVDGTISLLGQRFFLFNASAWSDFVKYIADQLVVDLESARNEIYKFSKTEGQAELRRFLSSLNISMSAFESKRLIELFAGYLSTIGMGVIRLTEISDDRIVLRVTDSSCSEGQPVGELFSAYIGGTLAGALELILNKPLKATETKCLAKGDGYCEIECRKID
jgi:KaiC/GvpD/RAD55 family RecA-like ATPase/predicted hydrocarbon binding protein